MCLFGGKANAYTQKWCEKGVGDARVWPGRGAIEQNPTHCQDGEAASDSDDAVANGAGDDAWARAF